MKKSTNHAKYENNDAVRKTLLKNFLKQLAEEVLLLKPSTILDAGSGEGFVLKYLTGAGLKAKMDGIDISEQAVKIAQESLKSATFKAGSIYKLPYKDGSFDVVLCNEVLEHLDNPKQALEELRRVSKKYIICSVPHEPWFMLGSLAGGKYITRFGNHPEHINHWTALGFKRFLQRNGLRVKKLHALKSFPWTLAVCEVE